MGQQSAPVEHPKRFGTVTGQTRLYRRNAVYYFRAIVPAELQQIIGKPEMKFSLKTKDLKEAKKRCNVASVKADAELNRARALLNAPKPATPEPVSQEELFHQVATWFVEEEQKAEEWAAAEIPNYDDEQKQEIRYTLIEEATEFQRAEPLAAVHCTPSNRSIPPLPSTAPAVVGKSKKLQKAEARKPSPDSLADQFLAARPTLKIEPGGADYKRLSALLRRAKVESLNRRIDRIDDVSLRPSDALFEKLFAHTAAPPAPKKSATLKQLTERFMAAQHATKANTTPITYAIPVRLLLEVLGEQKQISTITPDDILRAGETLKRIPAHVTQRFPGATLLKAISKADAMDNVERFSPQTIAKYFAGICTIFNFAVEEGLLESSPAKGKRLKERFRNKKKRVRQLFKDEELKAMFNAPLYTGCIDDEYGFAKAGPNRPRRARFWIPLLALHHGARLQELCQLYCEDVKEQNGIHYFSIRTVLDDEDETEKIVKTESSIRDVPIHPVMISLGFLDYVNEMRRAGDKARLFPELQLGKSTQRYSSVLSRWFARFAEKACGHKPKGVFHSFRHHFRTALFNAGVGIEMVKKLGGWSNDREEAVVNGYLHITLQMKAEAIAKVKYDGLDLSHLYQQQPQARFRQPLAPVAGVS